MGEGRWGFFPPPTTLTWCLSSLSFPTTSALVCQAFPLPSTTVPGLSSARVLARSLPGHLARSLLGQEPCQSQDASFLVFRGGLQVSPGRVPRGTLELLAHPAPHVKRCALARPLLGQGLCHHAWHDPCRQEPCHHAWHDPCRPRTMPAPSRRTVAAGRQAVAST